MKRYVLVAALFLTGCEFAHEQVTPLVAKVQAAGAGDLINVSGPAMERWFAANRSSNLNREVLAQCNAIRPSAAAAWHESTEGRMCQALANVSFFTPARPVGDHMPLRLLSDLGRPSIGRKEGK